MAEPIQLEIYKQDGARSNRFKQMPLYPPHYGLAPTWPFRTKIGFMFILMFFVLSMNVTFCTAEDTGDGTPCIILAKPDELYDLELTGKSDDTSLTITFSFDYQLDSYERLSVQGSYNVDNTDSTNGGYNIVQDSIVLCTFTYEGIEKILLSEKRAKLVVTSEEYYANLYGIHIDQASIQFDLPISFQIVVLLFTLIPFFLLLPDALKELTVQLDAEAYAKGVYGAVFGIMIPLVTIALTMILLGSLDFLR